MKIAVEGCCHGELDKIYETLDFLQQSQNIKIDLLLICGDFQSVRNKSDLHAMAVPPKYQKMNTFYKYYSGEKKAPILTIFIGGNHEASNYLQELPYGGWVAPNIYYMGYANVLQFGGLRIGGLSGIYKDKDFHRGHFERPPYNESSKRSVYHVRNLEAFRLKQLRRPIDIFLSHDWPRGIYHYGNKAALLRRKQYFRSEVEDGSLGSPVAEELLQHLQPEYWFSAHLHVKFAALVQHKSTTGPPRTTRFLALDKCLPRREFLQVFDIAPKSDKLELSLDPEWLAVLKSTNHLMSLNYANNYMPGIGSATRYDFHASDDDIQSIEADFAGVFRIPENFKRSAPMHDTTQDFKRMSAPPPRIYVNPQTTLLCDMLELTDPFASFTGTQSSLIDNMIDNSTDNKEVSSDDDDFIDTTMESSVNTTFDTCNPDEISLDDLDDDDDNDKKDEDVDKEDNEKLACKIDLAVGSVKGVGPEDRKILLSPEPAKMAVDPQSGTESPLEKTGDSLAISPKKRHSGPMDETPASATSTPNTASAKKFKRRNQSLYNAPASDD
ncbi:hypothetical protein NP493_44g00005 [Ridgeia piscesae]|uniref:Lariat debranching enzyme C-terminal domain-containing protein n=1 Tax=Ridgeia piscesae TaxID=27915 RepID=A0AAD9UJI0_RIDPI|nr:hypothetical protein NP493_44g00005 [Ridgeia piscesae]